jgi:hypothetical protein
MHALWVQQHGSRQPSVRVVALKQPNGRRKPKTACFLRRHCATAHVCQPGHVSRSTARRRAGAAAARAQAGSRRPAELPAALLVHLRIRTAPWPKPPGVFARRAAAATRPGSAHRRVRSCAGCSARTRACSPGCSSQARSHRMSHGRGLPCHGLTALQPRAAKREPADACVQRTVA